MCGEAAAPHDAPTAASPRDARGAAGRPAAPDCCRGRSRGHAGLALASCLERIIACSVGGRQAQTDFLWICLSTGLRLAQAGLRDDHSQHTLPHDVLNEWPQRSGAREREPVPRQHLEHPMTTAGSDRAVR